MINDLDHSAALQRIGCERMITETVRPAWMENPTYESIAMVQLGDSEKIKQGTALRRGKDGQSTDRF